MPEQQELSTPLKSNATCAQHQELSTPPKSNPACAQRHQTRALYATQVKELSSPTKSNTITITWNAPNPGPWTLGDFHCCSSDAANMGQLMRNAPQLSNAICEAEHMASDVKITLSSQRGAEILLVKPARSPAVGQATLGMFAEYALPAAIAMAHLAQEGHSKATSVRLFFHKSDIHTSTHASIL